MILIDNTHCYNCVLIVNLILGGILSYIIVLMMQQANSNAIVTGGSKNSASDVENKESRIIYIKLDIPAAKHIKKIFSEYIVKDPICKGNKCYLHNEDVLLYFPTGIHNFGLQPTQYKSIKFKSRLVIDIVNKETLHRKHKHGLAETYFLADGHEVIDKLHSIADAEPESIWIARPTYGFAGSDIVYIRAKDFNTELGKLNDKFMLSRIVIHPYLMEGRKIHIRRYAFAVYYGNTRTVRFGLVKNGVIGYAKGLYDADALDLATQDTHFKGRELIKYPDDFPTKEYIPTFERDLIEILTPIVSDAKISMYDDKNVTNAFEFLALDILIDTNNTDDHTKWKVVLLEINHKPGILAGTTDKPYEHCEYPLYNKLKHSHEHYFEYITNTVFGSLKDFILDNDDDNSDDNNSDNKRIIQI
jgi:hypothetical protein